MMSYRNRNSRIFVGNLPIDIRERDIEDLFCKYGKISSIDLINKRGTPFAFLQFEDPRDAEDAVNARNGYDYTGYKLRVEFPKRNNRRRIVRSSRSRSHSSRRSQGQSTMRSPYGVLVSGLPLTGSWQDLKDHMREAGNVCYANVHRDGTGTVEFERYEDMKYAVNKLDDSKFRSHEGEISYVRVKEVDHFSYQSRSYSPEQIRPPTMFSEELSSRFSSRSMVLSIPNRGMDTLMLPQDSQYRF